MSGIEDGRIRIVVDADACPVKDTIVEVAARFGAHVVMVASHNHRIEPAEGVTVVQVDASDQSTDLHIANRLRKRDVLVTQDFGLAAIGLAKGAVALSFRGQRYTAETIEYLLAHRHALSRQRRGGARIKGPRAMTDEDKLRFQHALTKVLTRLQENHNL